MNDLVGPWVRRFLVEYVMGERNYSPNTQHSYRDTFRLLLPLAAKQCRCTVENLTVNGIKPKLLREFTHYLEQVRHLGLVLWRPTVRNTWNGAPKFKPFISRNALLRR
jgi:site-specific recombinase XerD